MIALLEYSLALLPVLIFLIVLVLMDSFKLLSVRVIIVTIGMGILSAIVLIYINGWLSEEFQIGHAAFSRYLAPVTEEIVKSLFLIYLIGTNRTGFLVDSAIRGFAIGAGFALVENIFYHVMLEDQSLLLWIARGFGTAFLHGGTMTLFAIISRTERDRKRLPGMFVYFPGLVLAIIVHSLFNHFLLPPLILTAVTMVSLSIVIMSVYLKSEQKTREWLGDGLDLDMDLIGSITSGEVSETPVGKYLNSLIDRFKPIVVADMLCLIRIHAELAVAAKGILLANEVGLKLPPDESIKGKVIELKYLEKSIGRTGLIALSPFLQNRAAEQWQQNLLTDN